MPQAYTNSLNQAPVLAAIAKTLKDERLRLTELLESAKSEAVEEALEKLKTRLNVLNGLKEGLDLHSSSIAAIQAAALETQKRFQEIMEDSSKRIGNLERREYVPSERFHDYSEACDGALGEIKKTLAGQGDAVVALSEEFGIKLNSIETGIEVQKRSILEQFDKTLKRELNEFAGFTESLEEAEKNVAQLKIWVGLEIDNFQTALKTLTEAQDGAHEAVIEAVEVLNGVLSRVVELEDAKERTFDMSTENRERTEELSRQLTETEGLIKIVSETEDSRFKKATRVLQEIRAGIVSAKEAATAESRSLWDTFATAETNAAELRTQLNQTRNLCDETFEQQRRQVAAIVERIDALSSRGRDTAVAAFTAHELAERIEADLGETTERMGAAEGQIGNLYEEFAVAVEETDRRFKHTEERAVERVLATLKAALDKYEDLGRAWASHKQAFQDEINDVRSRWPTVPVFRQGSGAHTKDSFVSHMGGLWQAQYDTKEEPGVGDDWICLVPGLANIQVDRGAPAGDGAVKIRLEPTTGEVREFDIEWPVPRILADWRAKGKYRFNDSVLSGGTRYRAKCDDPAGPPEKFPAQWVLEVPPGPKGDMGDPGKKGDKGDKFTEDEVLRLWIDHLERDGAISITSYRGLWKYQRLYRKSQVVTFGMGLYLCRMDHVADLPPMSAGAIEQWLPLVIFDPASLGTIREENVTDLDRVRFKGTYNPEIANVKNDWVIDGGWGAVAITTTTERPSPVPSGSDSWNVVDTPVWDTPYPSVIGAVHSGHEYTFLESGWVQEVQVWVPELTPTTKYRFVFINLTDPDAPIARSIEKSVLNEDGWTTIALQDTIVQAGSKWILYIDALNSADSTIITGGWMRGVNAQTNAPATQSWNRNNAETIVRIDKTDLDSLDRSTDLMNVASGSVIQFVDSVDPGASVVYHVNAPPIDLGSYVEYTVSLDSVGPNGQPAVGATTTLTADTPIPQDTPYVVIADGQATSQPTWATVRGVLELDGAVQEADGDVYGIRLRFQPAYVSPDWHLVGRF